MSKDKKEDENPSRLEVLQVAGPSKKRTRVEDTAAKGETCKSSK